MADMNLNGRVVLVTGGSTGIGLGAAGRLIEAGAFVYVTGRRKKELDAAVAKLGANSQAIVADVSIKADTLRVAETIRRRHGQLDAVFANAGAGHPTPFEELTEEQIDQELSVNVKGVILTVQSLLPILRDGASIILNASITIDMGLPGFAVYAAAKAAVRSLAHSWTTDLKGRRIRVNSLSPGVVPTEGYKTEQHMTDADIEAFSKKASEDTPLGRVGTAGEMGDAVVFLASDASAFITGIDLVVDGGRSRVFPR